MQEIKFGTDGFRGIIADSFTKDSVVRIARAAAAYLLSEKRHEAKKGIVVGYDRRFHSENYAKLIADEISGRGIPVFLTDSPVPTPAVSCYIREKGLPNGIIVTASHNPPVFNGIKIKDEHGASAGKDVTALIEKFAAVKDNNQGNKTQTPLKEVEIISAYVKNLKKYLNIGLLKKSSFKVTVDVMHGVGTGIISEVLKGTKCKVNEIRSQRDVLFGGVNPEPIMGNLDALKNDIKKNRCDLALALDGDADRIGAMCPDGRFINSHMAICLLLLHFIENRNAGGKIVKSLNTTTMVDKIAEHYGLRLDTVPVGFKYIASKMLTEDVLIGGEESGGIGFKGYMPERDGSLAGLLLLELMACRKQGISRIIGDMEKRFGKFVYLRRDLHVRVSRNIPRPGRIAGKKVVQVHDYDGVKFILDDESWLLVRASGTEPIVRIYAESGSLSSTRKLIECGCSML